MELVIFSGIQCSGKSTYYHHRFAKTHFRINLDELKTRHKEWTLYAATLHKNLPVVIDNTNPTRLDRAKYIDQAKACGYRIVGFQFDIPIAVALTRSANRTSQKVVPPGEIHITSRKMQPLIASEGFNEMFVVSIGDGDLHSFFKVEKFG